MHLLIPSDPFNKSLPDEAYAEELTAFCALGWSASMFSFEDFEQGDFRARPPLPPGASVLYRGWMLSPDNYARLNETVVARGTTLNTSPEQYKLCHYLPGWYELCRDLTIPTVFAKEDSDFSTLLPPKGWQKYFVKDYVKSLTTARGSVAATVDEVYEVVALLRQYRGQVEGGVCIREFLDIRPETEERYFVFNGVAHARAGNVPELVSEVARHVRSPFFSVDVVETRAGELVVIELGDGQVSDRKNWTAQKFATAANSATHSFKPPPFHGAA